MQEKAITFYDRLRSQSSPRPIGCIGIDPSDTLLAQWGLPQNAKGALRFSQTILTAAKDVVRVVKPQVAYFEQFGTDGYKSLTEIISLAREMNFLVIADAKRGDIGSTSEAYGRAWLGPSAPMQVDAITLSPYLGFGSIEPILQRAAEFDAYVFVVARSSNPEGAQVQEAGRPKVWEAILDEIADWSARHNCKTVGAVVGATVPSDLKLALERLPEGLFLAPGIGKQGATTTDLLQLQLPLNRVIVSSSRGVAEHGPDVEKLKNAMSAFTNDRSS